MRILVDTKTQGAEISPYLFMQFMEPLGTADSSVDAGWDYLNNRWQPKLINIVKQLAPPMVRLGGCFASYYRWKEGVGPLTGRVPMQNLCWDGLYSNHVGTAEFVNFCRQVEAEPLIVVNMESDGRMNWAYPAPGMDRLGTVREAAEWVDYCNNPSNKLRLFHGAKEPYNIRYWQIGNETSYDKNGFDRDTAAAKTLEFAREMHAADSSIKLLAWGDSGWAPYMCDKLGDEVSHIAFHYHFVSALPDSPLYGTEYLRDPDETWRHFMSAYSTLEKRIAEIHEEVRQYGKRLAMTEGHFVLKGRNRCEALSSWAAGVAYARCVNVLLRAADILDIATLADFFGNRWQVNAVMLPTPIRNGPAYLQPVGEVMKLFSRHLGDRTAQVTTPPSSVDMTAAVSETENGSKRIFLYLVNTDRHNPARLEVTCDGIPVRSMRAYEIAADSTIEITPLNPNVFEPAERQIDGCVYELPAAGVAAVEADV